MVREQDGGKVGVGGGGGGRAGLSLPAASYRGARKRATSVLFEKFDARDAVVDPCYEDTGGSSGGGGKKSQQGGNSIEKLLA